MRVQPSLLVITLAAVATPATAQESPYVAHATSSIKALTPDEIAGYLGGAGMGFALAAELNGYPGPRHVLELADSLGLDADRRAAVQAIFDAMTSEARQLGAALVGAEAELDSAFVGGEITDAALEERVLRAGTFRARLRLAHLRAHLAVADLLTPAERRAYARLRGYGDSTATGHHH